MMSMVEKPKTGGKGNRSGCVGAGRGLNTQSMLQKKELGMTESTRLSSIGPRKESLDSVFGDMRLGEMMNLQRRGPKRGWKRTRRMVLWKSRQRGKEGKARKGKFQVLME